MTLYHGDVLATLRELPAESVDCVVTSPPYWGLRDYGAEGQLGLEPTPEQYVERMVEVFREVKRVLASHGTVWLNLGDSYAAARSYQVRDNKHTEVGNNMASEIPAGLKQKDLVGIPWRVAFALQADGWYLRSDIIWSKPNPMPESVTDRPTKAHEYVFLLSKQPRYFFDQEAVREPHRWQDEEMLRTNAQARQGARIAARREAGDLSVVRTQPEIGREKGRGKNGNQESEFTASPAGRNIRSVWEIATQPYPEAHFATFPEELARRCIAAGCPEQVCRVCGKARERVVEKETTPTQRVHNGVYDASSGFGKSGWLPGVQNVQTLGWTDCECSLSEREPLQPGTSTASAPVSRSESEQVSAQAKAGKAMGNHCLSEAVGVDTRRWVEAIIDRPPPPTTNYRPGIVLDPFMGSGTVAYVARKLGRHAVGIDLSESYLQLAARRLQQQSLFAEAL